jgi:predicted Zn-dependent peptidase
VHDALASGVFGEHPLGRDVLGEIPTVEAIGCDDIRGFFERWYHPTSMVVTAAGRLDHEEVVASMAARLGTGAGGQLPVRTPPAPAEARVVVERDDTEQAHLCLGWRSLDHHDDDRWALAVGNQILGGGMASRLFQEVREERGLAYSVYSYPSAFQDTGCLTLCWGTAPKRARESLAVIDDVVEGIRADGVTESERAVAAGYLEGSLLLGLEDSGGRMGRLGRSLVQRGTITSIDEHLARLRSVTIEDVDRVLHRVLDGPRTLAAVGPFEAADLVEG